MEGVATFLSSAFQSLTEALVAGNDEGIRIEVERIKDEEGREREEEVESRRRRFERLKIEQETKIGKERIRREQTKERSEKTAFWTTLGLRPLAEPPILDWDWLFRTRMPSDKRFEALFPRDPEKRGRMKDLQGEHVLLSEYTVCAQLMATDTETDLARRRFYKDLCTDLLGDWQEVFSEYEATWDTASALAWFEFNSLDNDGRTTQLEKWIKRGADIFHGQDDETRKKYGYLMPPGFVEDRLATFEVLFTSWHDGATSYIEKEMSAGNDLLIDWPQEVVDKYGHLRRLLPPSPPSSPDPATTPFVSARSSARSSPRPQSPLQQ